MIAKNWSQITVLTSFSWPCLLWGKVLGCNKAKRGNRIVHIDGFYKDHEGQRLGNLSMVVQVPKQDEIQVSISLSDFFDRISWKKTQSRKKDGSQMHSEQLITVLNPEGNVLQLSVSRANTTLINNWEYFIDNNLFRNIVLGDLKFQIFSPKKKKFF